MNKITEETPNYIPQTIPLFDPKNETWARISGDKNYCQIQFPTISGFILYFERILTERIEKIGIDAIYYSHLVQLRDALLLAIKDSKIVGCNSGDDPKYYHNDDPDKVELPYTMKEIMNQYMKNIME